MHARVILSVLHVIFVAPHVAGATKSAVGRIALLPGSEQSLVHNYFAKSPKELATGWKLRTAIDAALELSQSGVIQEFSRMPVEGIASALAPFLHGLADRVKWSPIGRLSPSAWRIRPVLQPIFRSVNARMPDVQVTTLRQPKEPKEKAHANENMFGHAPTQTGSSTRAAIAGAIEQSIARNDLSLGELAHLVMDGLAVIDPYHAQNGQPGSFPSGQSSLASYMFFTWDNLNAAPVPTAWMPMFGIASPALVWKLAFIRTFPVGIVQGKIMAEVGKVWPTEFAGHDLSHIDLNNHALGHARELWTGGKLAPAEQGLQLGARLAESMEAVPNRRLRNEIDRILALLVYEANAAPTVKSLADKLSAADVLLEHENKHVDAAKWTEAKDWLSARLDERDLMEIE